MTEESHTTVASAFLVWLFLVLATLCSGLLGEHRGLFSGTAAVSAIMLLAAIKGRAVILYFMEIKGAPLSWRIIFETWIWGICTLIAAIWIIGEKGNLGM
jgi:heme/copper-type cytochrome/quinol oxidase subunit 4